jgi:hypothetical protein
MADSFSSGTHRPSGFIDLFRLRHPTPKRHDCPSTDRRLLRRQRLTARSVIPMNEGGAVVFYTYSTFPGWLTTLLFVVVAGLVVCLVYAFRSVGRMIIRRRTAK